VPAKLIELPFAHAVDALAVNLDLSLRWPIEARHEVQQGGFARA
jgi:hypothetical protein